jgi:ABC-type nitrate/sulfonate/bicarbonate transport system substrate-binding protein
MTAPKEDAMQSKGRWLNTGSACLVAALALGWMGACAAAGAAPIKIRIAYPTGMNGQIPVVMERAGIAKKHGLDAEFVFFQYGPPMMEALASGHIDAVVTSLMPVTTFLSRQPNAAVVVASLGRSSYSLMVPKTSAAKSVDDLRGKRIAVSFNSDSHLDLLRLLKERKLAAGQDVRLLNVQPNELVFTLNEGFAEAVVIRQPQVLKMQQQFGTRIVHTWPFDFISIMRAEYLGRNPESLPRYRSALRESIHYAATNKEQASVWFGEKLRVEPEVVRQVSDDDPNLRTVKELRDVSIELSPTVRRRLIDWFEASYEHGMVKSRVDPNQARIFAN